MRYLLYLLGCFLLVGVGVVSTVTSSGFSMDFSNLMSFLDDVTLAFLLAVCLLVLVGTGSLRAFGRAIRSMFQKERLSAAHTQECLMAYRQVVVGSLLAGGLGALLDLVKMMHSLDGGGLENLGISLNLACLSLGYALFLNLLLLPVGITLKKRLQEWQQMEKADRPHGNMAVRATRRKAG